MKSIILIITIILIWGCLNQDLQNEHPEATASLKISTRLIKSPKINVSPIDSVDIKITHPTNPDYINRIKFDSSGIELKHLYPGSEHILSIDMYDSENTLLFTCVDSTINISKELTNHIQINCVSEYSSLMIYFPLGPGNPDFIDFGRLNLTNNTDTTTSNLIIEGEISYFNLPKIKGGLEYGISSYLYMEDSTLVFTGTESSLFIPKGSSMDFSITFQPMLGGLTLNLNIQEVPLINITGEHAHSIIRSPNIDDIVITEFYPSPSSSDGYSQGEWIEIYNRSHDTLQLENCRLAKSITSSSLTTSTQFEIGVFIEPGKTLVFGKDSVKIKDESLTMTLVDTKQNILLICTELSNDFLIDSILYSHDSQHTDSIPAEKGKVSSLNHIFLEDNSVGTRWCLTEPTLTPPAATPGNIQSSCL